jgi:hypothetical protein
MINLLSSRSFVVAVSTPNFSWLTRNFVFADFGEREQFSASLVAVHAREQMICISEDGVRNVHLFNQVDHRVAFKQAIRKLVCFAMTPSTYVSSVGVNGDGAHGQVFVAQSTYVRFQYLIRHDGNF